MLLIPEQILELRKKQKNLQQKINGFDEYRDSFDNTEVECLHAKVMSDYIVELDYNERKQELADINSALKNGIYLKSRTLNKINIGTRFEFQFLGEEEVCNYILVDKAIGVGSMQGFISRDSNVGKKLLNKESGEVIPDVGTIIDIKRGDNDYVHYIREKEETLRICCCEKEKLKSLRREKKTSKKAYQELEERNMITESQKALLELEKERLLLFSEDDSTIRKKEIDKILKTSQIATPPEDDSIGIGSKVVLDLWTETGRKIKTVEIINKAVSDELDGEYVERISALGSAIFGCQKGEKFMYRLDNRRNRYIRGIVQEVHNNEITRNDVLTYRKSR